jgi:hypothetical protein
MKSTFLPMYDFPIEKALFGLAGKDDILKVASYEDRINVRRSNIA